MRRLTVTLLALGCLALLAGTIAVSRPVPVNAAPIFDSAECPIDPSCPGGPDKVVVCHFDQSGKPHELCVNESAFNSHVGDGGHDRDFCVSSTSKSCEPEPPKPPVVE